MILVHELEECRRLAEGQRELGASALSSELRQTTQPPTAVHVAFHQLALIASLLRVENRGICEAAMAI